MNKTNIDHCLNTYSLLLVDDELMSLDLMKQMLQPYFKDIYTANNATEAFSIFLNKSIDIIVTDMKMPNGNGITLVENIRKHKSTVPIIFLSAYKNPNDLLKIIGDNVKSYIIKPVEINSLIEKITDILSNQEEYKVVRTIHKPFRFANGLFVNLETNIIMLNDQLVLLTKKEYLLLELLLKNSNSILTKESLESTIWPNGIISESSTRSLIIKLRKKIGHNTIATIKNLGYKINFNNSEHTTL